MRPFLCLSTVSCWRQMPSSVAVCRLYRGRAQEVRIAQETSLLCLSSVLCVQMRKTAATEV